MNALKTVFIILTMYYTISQQLTGTLFNGPQNILACIEIAD